MLGKKFYEKRFSPYPFPKSFLIFIRLYGVLYFHPKLATVSLVDKNGHHTVILSGGAYAP